MEFLIIMIVLLKLLLWTNAQTQRFGDVRVLVQIIIEVKRIIEMMFMLSQSFCIFL